MEFKSSKSPPNGIFKGKAKEDEDKRRERKVHKRVWLRDYLKRE